MNDLTIFENPQFGTIRTAMKDGEPIFVAADVCSALDIQNHKDAIKRLDDDEKSGVVLTDPHGRPQETNCVTESGLYSLVLGSRKPEAKQFKRWITHDVIPTIRKTGGYVNDEDAFVRTYLPNVDDNVKALFGQTLAALRSANKKIEEDKPKVLFADAVASAKTSILVGDLAKLIRQNGVEVGQNRLFSWLRANGYLCSKGDMWNMPTQSSMERGLFDIKVSTFINPDGSIRETRTVKVTGKGQNYFVNVFLKKEA